MASQNKYLSIDEIIALLSHSKAINIIVEGKDDSWIYRKIEEIIVDAEFVIAGGRTNLLEVFNRKAEFVKTKTVFLADKDNYIMKGVPKEYEEIIWTQGYSIENDLIVNSKIFELMDKSEYDLFCLDFNLLFTWFLYEIESGSQDEKLDIFLKRIIKDHKYTQDYMFVQGYQASREFSTFEKLLYFRGKNLLQLVVHILSAPERVAKYSKKAVLEIAFCFQGNVFYTETLPRLKKRIESLA